MGTNIVGDEDNVRDHDEVGGEDGCGRECWGNGGLRAETPQRHEAANQSQHQRVR